MAIKPNMTSAEMLKEATTQHLHRIIANANGNPLMTTLAKEATAELVRRGAEPIASATQKKPAATVATKPITKTPAPKSAPTKGTTNMSNMSRAECIQNLREIADNPKVSDRDRKKAGELLAEAGDRLPPEEHAKVLASMGIKEKPSSARTEVRADGSVEFRRILPSEARGEGGAR